MSSNGFTRGGLAALAVIALTACGLEPVTAPAQVEDVLALEERSTLDRHVFVLKEDAPSNELLREIEIRGGAVERQFDEFGVLTILGLNDSDAAEIASHREVDNFDRDMVLKWVPGFDETIGELVQGPSDESDQSSAFYFDRGMQWNMTQIQADDAWLASGQGEGTVVAVLDTGVDPFHIDLTGKVTANSASVLSPGSSPCGPIDENTVFDLDFHGTFVSGLISSNGIGMGSVSPDASIMGVKVLNCTGSGSFGDIIGGMAYAYYNGADVLNMSLGAYFSQSLPGASALVDALERATSYIAAQGVLVVGSAGNDAIDLDNDGDFIHVPSELDGVMSVGATAPIAQMDFDMLASYTNYGLTGVDIMAPGGDLTAGGVCGFFPIYRCDLVLSAISSFVAPGPNFYGLSGGTSFAAPHVAGTGSVLMSTPGFAGTNFYACILAGADDLGAPGPDPLYSHGRLNVIGALNCNVYDGPTAPTD